MPKRWDLNDLLAEASTDLARISAYDAHIATVRGALILDVRQDTDRSAWGIVPGSVHTPRTTLEWQVDPVSGHQCEKITGFDQRLIVMCNEGYSSLLAAHTLRRLGFANTTDMIGGFAAWSNAGLPVVLNKQHH